MLAGPLERRFSTTPNHSAAQRGFTFAAERERIFRRWSGRLFLELNGYRFTATEEDAANAVLALAAAEIDEAAFTAFLRRNTRVVEPEHK